MTGIGEEIIHILEDLDFPEDEIYQDPETGVYNIVLPPGHFFFWPCKCGDTFGRHSNIIGETKNGPCFDCECKEFNPTQKFQAWRNTQK